MCRLFVCCFKCWVEGARRRDRRPQTASGKDDKSEESGRDPSVERTRSLVVLMYCLVCFVLPCSCLRAAH